MNWKVLLGGFLLGCCFAGVAQQWRLSNADTDIPSAPAIASQPPGNARIIPRIAFLNIAFPPSVTHNHQRTARPVVIFDSLIPYRRAVRAVWPRTARKLDPFGRKPFPSVSTPFFFVYCMPCSAVHSGEEGAIAHYG
ncbi:hypothetical protein [Paraburkholderia fungorum]|uniref:Uncharacterized protein n=1 Tax=Paraburkholderia fungorum TaxID=134537 RepID=A0AAP5UW55_9BURK|nr:hypothetical protein [Paraburkholderia fungorum]MDT8841033.1 hypothetical protein [Paraburkholderia fungorum]PRZ56349.1 hypothetical protein BX589_102551 [Paraburkholderia fungorum]USU14201.1 hypothetical protein NFE55_11125 [Paraburkholderia fungorum]USU22149.1 hypothetical protein NFS19_11125 [Paraburkholderia fungorum]